MEITETILLGLSVIWLGISILGGARFVIKQTVKNFFRFVTEFSVFAFFLGASLNTPIAYIITFMCIGIFACVFVLLSDCCHRENRPVESPDSLQLLT
jgi:hypothetical protein